MASVAVVAHLGTVTVAATYHLPEEADYFLVPKCHQESAVEHRELVASALAVMTKSQGAEVALAEAHLAPAASVVPAVAFAELVPLYLARLPVQLQPQHVRHRVVRGFPHQSAPTLDRWSKELELVAMLAPQAARLAPGPAGLCLPAEDSRMEKEPRTKPDHPAHSAGSPLMVVESLVHEQLAQSYRQHFVVLSPQMDRLAFLPRRLATNH